MKVFFPLESSGFAIPLPNAKWAIVDMGCVHGVSFLESLDKYDIHVEDISILALTHLHVDHINEEGILEIMQHNTCEILCPKLCFGEICEHDNPHFHLSKKMNEYDHFTLVEEKFVMKLRGVVVRGVPSVHEFKGEFVKYANFSYRINGHLISGDTPTSGLFCKENLAFLTEGPDPFVRTLALNLAQYSRDDVMSQDYVDDFRKSKYLAAHGLLEDFLVALRDPQFKVFFTGLETLVPTHIRRLEINDSFELYQNEIKKNQGSYDFELNSEV